MPENKGQQIDQLNREIGALYEQGRYAEAVQVAAKAYDLTRGQLGSNHPHTATSLNDLAELYRAMGNYAAAEPLHRQALDIRLRSLGPRHLHTAGSLNNLGLLYQAMGNHVAAEPLLRQALDIQQRSLGENHPLTAMGLNNLAELFRVMGDYATAEPLHRQALDIRRRSLGAEHPDTAGSLNNLGLLYQAMGNNAAAEPLHRQALDIYRRALGEEHPHTAMSLSNLGLLYMAMGNYAAAEPLWQQAYDMYRRVLGEEHPATVTSLSNLAGHYQAMGGYAAAEPLYRQALEIQRRVLGEEHPDTSVSLNNLAGLYHEMGDYAAAEPLHRKALEIRRRVLGEEHPATVRSLNNVAALCAATGRAPEALALMSQAQAIDERLVGQVFSIGSEGQRLAYVESLRRNLELYLSLVLQHFARDDVALRGALELVLRRKAIGAEALAAQRDSVLGAHNPGLASQLQELTALRRQIAARTLAGPGTDGLEAHQTRLAQWDAERERLEAALARSIPAMHLEARLKTVNPAAVAKALPEGSALIELLHIHVFDFEAVRARKEPEWKSEHYLAFVVLAGQPEVAQMVDLGEAAVIDQRVAAFRQAVTGEPEKPRGAASASPRTTKKAAGFFARLFQNRGDIQDASRDLGALPAQPVEALRDTDGASLREIVFDSLLLALGGRRRLFLSPDGDLTRLPFEILPSSDCRRLIDDYHLSYLAAGRDILRLGQKPPSRPAASLIVADPDFDLGQRWDVKPLKSVRGRRSRDLQRDLRFARLPGTDQEGQEVAHLLRAQLWLAGEAMEARLKAIHSPRILHLATHGFFLEHRPEDPNQVRRDFGVVSDRLAASRLENPLLRSGVALAGANTFLAGGSPPEEAEDGLLTAEDVTGLDLLDTELVVLSACDTGLGAVRTGEGVFGLRRAFVLAGAKTLVMSLWKVPDAQTRELMADFYRRLLMGEPRAEALRLAQLALKARYPNPRDWGAFICQGEPAELAQI